jgi:serine/threonine protein kinase
MEFCPVCMLRKGLAGGVESGESSASEDTIKPTPEHAVQRFEHYALLNGEDGKPVELGRGAMGVTYKAADVDLHCPVTLKVISERYLGDELARIRFLREARAAASVRHPNVASVFHLGRTGQNYFYAMEYIDGETLENLIKRSGRLAVKLALEITTQVGAGLAAVHEKNLVHRDIKPTNFMVSLKEDRSVTAKIIDLGLAKTLDESASEAGISSPWGICRDTRVCQSRAVRRCRGRHPLGSLLHDTNCFPRRDYSEERHPDGKHSIAQVRRRFLEALLC